MPLSNRSVFRFFPALLALAGVSLLVFPRPLHAQTAPTVTLSCPAIAGRPTTRVIASYTLPSRYRLSGQPYVEVKDAAGKVVEHLPLYTTQQLPNGRAQRDLRTRNYRAGVYTVVAQIEYLDGSGARGEAVSTPAALTVTR